ncbi:MAG TPA: hypothetical protein VFP72_19050 [Kineosporiaceae bacterium]|nr:hypothetical protein [Kineosporiaceae bacterium]
MTLLALGVAVNLPEGRLHAILEGLVSSGQVRRRGSVSRTMPGPRTAHYLLATGRHSASVGVLTRRTPAEHSTPEQSREHTMRGPMEPYPPSLRPAAVTPTGMRSTGMHGI